MSKERNQLIAETILAQLGGSKFKIMTGAYSFSSGDDGKGPSLSMRLPSNNPKRVGGVRITLDASDTYTMIAFAMKGSFKAGNFRVEETYKESGLYADNLATAFTEATGLATSL